jgi:DNA-binding NarL/FixJ family response regulator
VEPIERIIAEAHPQVIVLSGAEGDDHAFDALRAGASGFLPLDTDPAELLRAVRIVAGGAMMKLRARPVAARRARVPHRPRATAPPARGIHPPGAGPGVARCRQAPRSA